MFSSLFGINIKETPTTYIVSGINGYDIGNFISKVWKTSVLEKYMFKKITGGRFGTMEFYKFFLIDVVYMLEKLASLRNPRVPARTLHQIVEKLREHTWLKEAEDTTITRGMDFNKLKLFEYKPFPHQMNWLSYYNGTPSKYRLKGSLLNGSARRGEDL